ncbi:MAG: TetR/AcrR family transcriptional regulator [Marmoricola sp.]
MTEIAGARERLLAAAVRVIGEYGIGGLTNRRVCAAAGVSPGSLTYHFATQNDLIREAVITFVAEESQRIHGIVDELRSSISTVEEAALAAQRAIEAIALGSAEIGVFEVYLHAARDPELQGCARDCYAAYDDAARAIMAALDVPGDDARAAHLVAFISGSQLRRLATGRENSQFADGLLRLIS